MQIEIWHGVPLTDAEVMQATGDHHQQVGGAIFGQAQNLFDDATAFDAGDDVFDYDAHTGDHGVEELVSLAEWLAAWLFWGWRVSTSAGS